MTRRYAILVDLNRCLGCHTCAVGCKMENAVPAGVKWLRVVTVGGASPDTPSGKFPNVSMHYQPLQCNHCDDAPCIEACPTGSLYQRPDGIVLVDPDKCNGCMACLPACPYEALQVDARTQVALKCTMCHHRVDRGLEPFCIAVCPGRARFFGDIGDPGSAIAKLADAKRASPLASERGAMPSIYYTRAK